jgi:hypothetical protein
VDRDVPSAPEVTQEVGDMLAHARTLAYQGVICKKENICELGMSCAEQEPGTTYGGTSRRYSEGSSSQ